MFSIFSVRIQRWVFDIETSILPVFILCNDTPYPSMSVTANNLKELKTNITIELFLGVQCNTNMRVVHQLIKSFLKCHLRTVGSGHLIIKQIPIRFQ